MERHFATHEFNSKARFCRAELDLSTLLKEQMKAALKQADEKIVATLQAQFQAELNHQSAEKDAQLFQLSEKNRFLATQMNQLREEGRVAASVQAKFEADAQHVREQNCQKDFQMAQLAAQNAQLVAQHQALMARLDQVEISRRNERKEDEQRLSSIVTELTAKQSDLSAQVAKLTEQNQTLASNLEKAEAARERDLMEAKRSFLFITDDLQKKNSLLEVCHEKLNLISREVQRQNEKVEQVQQSQGMLVSIAFCPSTFKFSQEQRTMATALHLSQLDSQVHHMFSSNAPQDPLHFTVRVPPLPNMAPVEYHTDPTYFYIPSPITPGCHESQFTQSLNNCDHISSFGDSDEEDEEAVKEATILQEFQKAVQHEGDMCSIMESMSGFQFGTGWSDSFGCM